MTEKIENKKKIAANLSKLFMVMLVPRSSVNFNLFSVENHYA